MLEHYFIRPTTVDRIRAAWLGEPIDPDRGTDVIQQTPRCNKDLIEEALFEHSRDLFSGLELAFFDTTSIYFEGDGGESIGNSIEPGREH